MYVCMYVCTYIHIQREHEVSSRITTHARYDRYASVKRDLILQQQRPMAITFHAYLHEHEEQIRVSASRSLTPALGYAAEGNSSSKRRRVVAQQVQRCGVKVGPDTNS